MTPTLVSISPSVGSSGGQNLTVTGVGFGADTEGLNLAIGGVEICETVSIIEYGWFSCFTKAMEIQSSDSI